MGMARARAEQVVAQLHGFGLSRDRFRGAVAGLVGIGLSDLDALEYLERYGAMTQRELGERLLLTSGAVTLLVDRLEHLHLARRRPHPEDRRVTLVELAPDTARPTLPEMDDYHDQLLAAARALSPAARSEVRDFLAKITRQADHDSELMRARTRPRKRPTTDKDR
jgi:DNA-binding MarR family transcriptional regulator